MYKQNFKRLYIIYIYLVSNFLADCFSPEEVIKQSGKFRRLFFKQYKVSDKIPVVGSWMSWGPWSCCSGECGHLGYQTRRRVCVKFENVSYEFRCFGRSLEFRGCYLTGCQPKDFEALLANDPLRLNEYKYLQQTHSQFPALIPRCLVADCRFETISHLLRESSDRYWNALQCVKHDVGCPVHGEWGDWAPWSRCSAWCGEGKKFRCRFCDKPVPTYPELNCKGDNCTYGSCYGSDCSFYKGSWSAWSVWGPCSATCGFGIVRRFRKCIKKERRDLKKNVLHYFRAYSVKSTMNYHKPASVNESDVVLPVKKLFNVINYGASFSPASETSLPRIINVTSPIVYESSTVSANTEFDVEKLKTDCTGPHEIIESCYLRDCILDGGWSDWSAWSACSADCGRGTQIRSRTCNNPPAQKGGSPCAGPITWIRHCYQIPCEVKMHEVLLFSGNSLLKFLEPLQPTSLFHLYLRFKPIDGNGDLMYQFDSGCTNFKQSCDYLLLKLTNGRLLFTAQLTQCKTMINSTVPLLLNEWHDVLLTITGKTARLRIDDDTNTVQSQLNCRPPLKTFKYEMEIGNKFQGMIQWLILNFTPISFRKENNRTCGKSAVEVLNVEPVTVPIEDSFVDLNQLIRVPCPANDTNWVIEIALLPQTNIGVLLYMRGSEPTDFLVVTLEMNRIRLVVHVQDYIVEAEEPEEIHPNKWLYIIIDKKEDGIIGLNVNGGHRHSLFYNIDVNETIPNVTCSSAILVGHLPLKIKKKLSHDVQHVIPVSSIDGKLGIIKMNYKLFDLHTLNRQTQSYSKMYSSYSASITNLYEELVLVRGEKLKLTCLYDHYSENGGATRNCSVNTVWSRLDRPIFKSPDISGVSYEIEDNKRMTHLKFLSFPSREAVEGFYSCWVHKVAKGYPEQNFVTFGVLLLDIKKDYSQSIFTILVIFSKILFAFFILIWLLYQFASTIAIGHGLFKSEKLNRNERKKRMEEMILSPEGTLLLGSKDAVTMALENVKIWEKKQYELEKRMLLIRRFSSVKDLSLPFPSTPSLPRSISKSDPDVIYYQNPNETDNYDNYSQALLDSKLRIPDTSQEGKEGQEESAVKILKLPTNEDVAEFFPKQSFDQQSYKILREPKISFQENRRFNDDNSNTAMDEKRSNILNSSFTPQDTTEFFPKQSLEPRPSNILREPKISFQEKNRVFNHESSNTAMARGSSSELNNSFSPHDTAELFSKQSLDLRSSKNINIPNSSFQENKEAFNRENSNSAMDGKSNLINNSFSPQDIAEYLPKQSLDLRSSKNITGPNTSFQINKREINQGNSNMDGRRSNTLNNSFSTKNTIYNNTKELSDSEIQKDTDKLHHYNSQSKNTGTFPHIYPHFKTPRTYKDSLCLKHKHSSSLRGRSPVHSSSSEETIKKELSFQHHVNNVKTTKMSIPNNKNTSSKFNQEKHCTNNSGVIKNVNGGASSIPLNEASDTVYSQQRSDFENGRGAFGKRNYINRNISTDSALLLTKSPCVENSNMVIDGRSEVLNNSFSTRDRTYSQIKEASDSEIRKTTEKLQNPVNSQNQPRGRNLQENLIMSKENLSKLNVRDGVYEPETLITSVDIANNENSDYEINNFLENFDSSTNQNEDDKAEFFQKSRRSICIGTDNPEQITTPAESRTSKLSNKFRKRIASGIHHLLEDFTAAGNRIVAEISSGKIGDSSGDNRTEGSKSTGDINSRIPYRNSKTKENGHRELGNNRNSRAGKFSPRSFETRGSEIDELRENSATERDFAVPSISLMKKNSRNYYAQDNYNSKSENVITNSPKNFKARDSNLYVLPEDPDNIEQKLFGEQEIEETRFYPRESSMHLEERLHRTSPKSFETRGSKMKSEINISKIQENSSSRAIPSLHEKVVTDSYHQVKYFNDTGNKSPTSYPYSFMNRESSMETRFHEFDIVHSRMSNPESRSNKNAIPIPYKAEGLSEENIIVNEITPESLKYSPNAFKTRELGLNDTFQHSNSAEEKATKIPAGYNKKLFPDEVNHQIEDHRKRMISPKSFKTKHSGINNDHFEENELTEQPLRHKNLRSINKNVQPERIVNVNCRQKIEPEVQPSKKRASEQINNQEVPHANELNRKMNGRNKYSRCNDKIAMYYVDEDLNTGTENRGYTATENRKESCKIKSSSGHCRTADFIENQNKLWEQQNRNKVTNTKNQRSNNQWNKSATDVSKKKVHYPVIYHGTEQQRAATLKNYKRKLNDCQLEEPCCDFESQFSHKGIKSQLNFKSPKHNSRVKESFKTNTNVTNIDDRFSRRLQDAKKRLRPIKMPNIDYTADGHKSIATSYSKHYNYNKHNNYEVNENDFTCENESDISLTSSPDTPDSRDSIRTGTRNKYCSVMLERMSMPYDITGGCTKKDRSETG